MTSQPFTVPQPMLSYASPSLAAQKRLRLGDKYFYALSIVLMGYALAGRGFAYIGVAPLFIGEIMLLTGVFVMFKLGMIGKLLGVRTFIPLMLFMCWGCARTIPYFSVYGADAIRDGVIWGYGTYAFIVAGLLMNNPLRVQKLIFLLRKYVVWFLVLAPFFCIATTFFEASLPTWPGSGVPVIQVKGGDLCVHLAGAFAFIVALGGPLNPWIAPILVPLNLGLNLQGRSAMVSFCAAAGVTMLLRPFHHRAMRIFIVIALGLFFLWASDLHVEKGNREISFEQIIKGVTSVAGNSGDDVLDGTKQWRLNWWSDIVGYTFYGQYFWTGKGYGINLATDDGYQVEADDALRSPHNGHMTMLARGGVPGLAIWLTTQLFFLAVIVKSYLRARRKGHENWSGMFLFLGAYWAAFMANCSFDVFIEGPMGGIWLWCVYGAGIGCVWIYKRYPELLTPEPAPLDFTPTFG